MGTAVKIFFILMAFCRQALNVSADSGKLSAQFYTNAMLFSPACNATTTIPATTGSIVSPGGTGPGIGRLCLSTLLAFDLWATSVRCLRNHETTDANIYLICKQSRSCPKTKPPLSEETIATNATGKIISGRWDGTLVGLKNGSVYSFAVITTTATRVWVHGWKLINYWSDCMRGGINFIGHVCNQYQYLSKYMTENISAIL